MKSVILNDMNKMNKWRKAFYVCFISCSYEVEIEKKQTEMFQHLNGKDNGINEIVCFHAKLPLASIF